jgi:ankyrin repeat protein
MPADVYRAGATLGAAELDALLTANPDANMEARGPDDELTALLLAASQNRADLIRVLAKHGADLEARDPATGYTALAVAVRNEATDAVQELLDRGANKEAQVPTTGWTPLFIAIKHGHAESFELLIKAHAQINACSKPQSDWVPLIAAAYYGEAVLLRRLLDAGANKRAVTDDGENALHKAAYEGHLECAKVLLEGDTSNFRDAANARGQTPLDMAQDRNHPRVAELLSRNVAVTAVVSAAQCCGACVVQ